MASRTKNAHGAIALGICLPLQIQHSCFLHLRPQLNQCSSPKQLPNFLTSHPRAIRLSKRSAHSVSLSQRPLIPHLSVPLSQLQVTKNFWWLRLRVGDGIWCGSGLVIWRAWTLSFTSNCRSLLSLKLYLSREGLGRSKDQDRADHIRLKFIMWPLGWGTAQGLQKDEGILCPNTHRFWDVLSSSDLS